MSIRELLCPSCDEPMRSVERRGVVIELCRDCEGVFLDRGEVDKLLDVAEADRLDFGLERLDDHDDDRRLGGRGERRRRRGGVLGDLFDFD